MLRTARTCRTLLDRDGFSPLGAVIVAHWLGLVGAGSEVFLLTDYPQHQSAYGRSLWMLAGLGAAFLVWRILRFRGVVSAASGLGIVFAALALALRFAGECCLYPVLATVDGSLVLTSPSPPSASWRELQDYIVVYRVGGAAAFAVGLLLAIWCGVQDARARRSARGAWAAW